MPFTRVLYESNSHIWQEGFEIIGDEEAWCEFWSQLYSRGSPPRPCDTTLIDFSTEVAIVAAIGAYGNGCHGVYVTCVRKPAGGGNIAVEATAIHGGPRCGCTANVVSPLEVVKIPRFGTRRINLKMRTEIIECD